MKHAVEHDLDAPTCRKVTRLALDAYAARYQKYNPQVRWNGEDAAVVAFTVKGMHLEGRIELRSGRVEMDLDVPLLLRPFKSEALRVIDREIRSWIDKQKRGEIE